MAKVGRECGRVLLGLAEVRNNLKRLRTLKSASFLSSERMVAIQDRKRVARRRSNCEARFAPRGGFDLDTRRKPQAYLAGAVSDAGIMDIECHFLV